LVNTLFTVRKYIFKAADIQKITENTVLQIFQNLSLLKHNIDESNRNDISKCSKYNTTELFHPVFFLVPRDLTGQYQDLLSGTHGIWDRIKLRGKRITAFILIFVVICGTKDYNLLIISYI
jgi:hypothetical protein